MDLSRFCAAPSALLIHFPFEKNLSIELKSKTHEELTLSQKLSAAIAVSLVSFLWFLFVSFAFEKPGFEKLGFALGPVIFGLLIGTLGGFIGGAIKHGAFKTAFYWVYITSVIGGSLILFWSNYDYLFLGRV